MHRDEVAVCLRQEDCLVIDGWGPELKYLSCIYEKKQAGDSRGMDAFSAFPCGRLHRALFAVEQYLAKACIYMGTCICSEEQGWSDL